jgi:zinc protease
MLKSINRILLMLLLFFLPLSATDENNNSKFQILDNGLKVVLVQRDNIPLVNMVFSINVGSKDETVETGGLVHLLEHLILLGETQFKGSDEMNLELRKRGARFNAHTSHDLMTFEFSLPAEYWESGLKLLKEKLFHLKFSKEKLEREKKIIFEEMAQNHDNPYKRGILLTLQHLFKNHPYEQPISGYTEVIEGVTIETLKTFYNRYFIPANCSLGVVGDIYIKEGLDKIKTVFGNLEKSQSQHPATLFKDVQPLKKKETVKETMDIQQSRLIIGFHAPPSNHRDQLAMEVFNQIVGKGLNPLLTSVMVRRGRRITFGVSTQYIPLKYGGAFLVFLTTTPKNLKAAKTAVLNFFNKRAWNFKYSLDDYPQGKPLHITDYLKTAKSTIKYHYQQFQERGMNAAISYSRYFLFHHVKNQEDKTVSYMERLEKIGSNNIRDVVSKYLSGKKYISIEIQPSKKQK